MPKKLKETEFQKQIRRCKSFYENNIEQIHVEFLDRYVESEDVEEMPIEIFYPTTDYTDIIEEYVAQHPLDFSCVGTEADFLRRILIESSNLKAMMIQVYTEQANAKKSYVYIKPKLLLENGEELIFFDFEIMPTDECYPTYDEATNEISEFIWQRERQVSKIDSPDEIITIMKTTTFTMESIKTEITDTSGKELAEYPPIVTDNTFGAINLFGENVTLPIVEFNTFGKDVKYQIPSYKLIEIQNQINEKNTHSSRTIIDHAHPLYVATKTFRDWSTVDTSPDSIIACKGDEDLKKIPSNLQLEQLDVHLQILIDKAYNAMGLLSKKQRLEQLGTDSSKVAKIGNSKLISMIKINLIFSKKGLNKIAKLLLLSNGYEYTDEKVMPPEEILPFDLETILNAWAIGMNLGLLDDELFWNKYFPELNKTDRERIRDAFDKRSDLNVTNTNVDNTAKPAGNKEQASNSKEERDIESGKGK